MLCTWEGDLKQDVVEEQCAEDASQLLPLLDVKKSKSLAEVVPTRLLQPLHVKTSLQLAPEMSPFLFDTRGIWHLGMRSRSYLWMWYSTQLVITWLVHWFIDSMALMICKETSSILEGNCNDHPEQPGGGVLLALQVVPHQVHILLGQQQGHLFVVIMKRQNRKDNATLVLTATRSSAKCCSSCTKRLFQGRRCRSASSRSFLGPSYRLSGAPEVVKGVIGGDAPC